MTTIQLRRYDLKPELVDDFVAWFQRLIDVRRAFGFTLEFAYLDRAHHEFTWAVSHTGDFDAAELSYMSSPERRSVFEGAPEWTVAQKVAKVESVISPV